MLLRGVVIASVVVIMAGACGTDEAASTQSVADRLEAVTDVPSATAGSTAPSSGAATTAAPGSTAPTTSAAGPSPPEPDRTEPAAPAWAPTTLTGEVEAWTIEIIDVRPHDDTAFTQGLELHDGRLLESTGLTGRSTIRAVDVETGEVTSSLDLDPDLFAEGLTVSTGRLIQLTFKAGVAHVRDLETLAQTGEFSYEGQGWGICSEGERLVMSNGSATLTFRDPSTFAVVDTVDVTLGSDPVNWLNELECVDGYVLANVWRTTSIVVIEPATGRIVAVIDAHPLTIDAIGAVDNDRVLNGIARLDPETFLLTGKEWPTMYRVRFVEA